MGSDGAVDVEACFIATLELKTANLFIHTRVINNDAGLTVGGEEGRRVWLRWRSFESCGVSGRTPSPPEAVLEGRGSSSLESTPPRNHNSRRALRVARRLGTGAEGEGGREEAREEARAWKDIGLNARIKHANTDQR